MKTYQIGDYIGKEYKIYKILGGEKGQGGVHSGMGIVNVCYHEGHKSVYALKTFQDKYLSSQAAKDNFKREALAWISLERHPCIVRAQAVEELDYRLFIELEYIAPDDEGRNTLTHYLRHPLELKQILEWSIQFCNGMEHAKAKGITPHRDIKPDNIMITQDKILKITDFGLARMFDQTSGQDPTSPEISEQSKGLSFLKIANGREVAGTPPWMAPEQFEGQSDERSDIYSFGIVLHQLISGSIYPFTIQSRGDWAVIHKTIAVPKLDSPLFPIIHCCLQKNPDQRYAGFSELKEELIKLYHQKTGREAPKPPVQKELKSWEYNNKGVSLYNLGLREEAIAAFHEALRINPVFAEAYNNLGNTLFQCGRLEEAIVSYHEAIKINSKYYNAYVNLGIVLDKTSRIEEAISAYCEALRINPDFAEIHYNLGIDLEASGRLEDAIVAYRQALRINPEYVEAYLNLGSVLFDSDRLEESITVYRQALQLNPEYAKAHNNLANTLRASGKLDEAIFSYRQALRLNPDFIEALCNLGSALAANGQFQEAIASYQESIRLNPHYANAHYNLGNSLQASGLLEEAIAAFRNFIKLAPGYLSQYAEKAQQKIFELEKQLKQKN